jgi:hypothetical protein
MEAVLAAMQFPSEAAPINRDGFWLMCSRAAMSLFSLELSSGDMRATVTARGPFRLQFFFHEG